jgi:tRNA-Thr(GGU) m(6)t(6)A37 methyltransferase TsaA
VAEREVVERRKEEMEVGSPSDSRNIIVHPIGVVHTPFTDHAVKSAITGVEGSIEVYHGFREGVKALEGFSHLIVVAFLNRVSPTQRHVLRVRYRRLRRFGLRLADLPEVGVFSSDAPHRPNPIAISIVTLVRRADRVLHVTGLDLFNGTPVLDLKPYTPDRAVAGVRVPKWYRALEKQVAENTGINRPRL